MLNAPSELLEIQRWFGKVITLPLKELSEPYDIPEYDDLLQKQCALCLTDGPHLKSYERIGIYNRLYWYRLFDAFHTSFPFLSRLFGFEGLHEKIAQPYLLKYPPSHWSLNKLGQHLLKWIEEDYSSKDKSLVLWAASLDLAFERVFLAPAFPPLSQDTKEEITLQPFVKVFKMPADFFTFRKKFLEHPVDHWIENDFPSIQYDRDYYFVLHRSSEGIVYEEICAARYSILHLLEKGISLPDLCEKLESASFQIDGLQQWFCDWTILGWLTKSFPPLP